MSLPGGIGISGLAVYDWPASDGLCGGSPHMHLLCQEAYVVTAGEGSVQTLTWNGGFAETPLTEGAVVSFSPGTIHRLVNTDGALRILVIMANSGLPEAGDAVLTFPSEVLADPAAYQLAAQVSTESEAKARRDLALSGFEHLRSGGHDALHAFDQAALKLVAARLPEFEKRWQTGALAAAQATGEQLARLHQGDFAHLRDARIAQLPSSTGLGMCGHLDRVI